MPSDLKPVVLITRPARQAAEFATLLSDGPVVISPILRIVPVEHDRDRVRQAEAFVFTSVHAVPAAGKGGGRLAYCVGTATAAAARSAGFRAIAGPGNLDGLCPMLKRAEAPLLHLRGRHVAGESGVPDVVVYDQQSQSLNADAVELLAGQAPVILPLFSPRSACLLAQAVSGSAAPLRPVAISAAAAAAWIKSCPRSCIAPLIAARPDVQSMRETIIPLQLGEQS